MASTKNAPGARIKIVIGSYPILPSAASGRICCPKSWPAPRSSRTAPIQVILKVNPRPIPIPSKSDGIGGFLEAYASATGVARTAREFLEIRKDESVLRDLDPDEITSKDVYDAAMKNDKIALEIFEATGSMLGEAFADFVAFSSPEAIILFGGLTKAGDLIMNPIKRSMEKNMLKVYAGKTKLLFSQLKESDAAVLGASALGWEVRDQSAGLEV